MTTKEKLRIMAMSAENNDDRINAYLMTNRELFNMYEAADGHQKYYALAEMTRRINRNMITPDVVPIFKQLKLNGAGDQTW